MIWVEMVTFNLNETPEIIFDIILEYALNIDGGVTFKSLESDASVCLELCLVFKRLGIMGEHLHKIRRLRLLLRKYHVFSVYDPDRVSECPLLLDALSSGCNYIWPMIGGSVKEFGNDVKRDIIDLIKLVPSSVNYKMEKSIVYGRSYITPLYIACLNPKIPLNIVKMLFEHGADNNKYIYVQLNKNMNYKWIKKNIWEDLENNLSNGSRKNWDRYMKILQL
jgi:hypothetical protein